jgi:hypothetical protein
VKGVNPGTATITYSIGPCTSTQTITVNPLPAGISSPQGTYSINELKMYPNPATRAITIETQVAGTFIIYSLEGKDIQQYVVKQGKTKLNLTDKLATGVYLCKFTGNNGVINMARLVYTSD